MGEKTKCICGKPAGSNRYMIFCNGCHCWLHCSCLGITKRQQLPEEWYCPKCAGSLRQEFNDLKKMVETFIGQAKENSLPVNQENATLKFELSNVKSELEKSQYLLSERNQENAMLEAELSEVKSELEKSQYLLLENEKVISQLQTKASLLSEELSYIKSELSEKLKIISKVQERNVVGKEMKNNRSEISCQSASSRQSDNSAKKKRLSLKSSASQPSAAKRSPASQPLAAVRKLPASQPSSDHGLEGLDPEVFQMKRKVL